MDRDGIEIIAQNFECFTLRNEHNSRININLFKAKLYAFKFTQTLNNSDVLE